MIPNPTKPIENYASQHRSDQEIQFKSPGGCGDKHVHLMHEHKALSIEMDKSTLVFLYICIYVYVKFQHCQIEKLNISIFYFRIFHL